MAPTSLQIIDDPSGVAGVKRLKQGPGSAHKALRQREFRAGYGSRATLPALLRQHKPENL